MEFAEGTKFEDDSKKVSGTKYTNASSTRGTMRKSASKRHIMKYSSGGDHINGSRTETASMYSTGGKSHVSGTSSSSRKRNSLSDARKYDVIW